jgi:histidinol-phosphate aminotransferase
MTGDPRLTPLVQSLPRAVPFVGPEALERERGRPFRARLGANESVFGPSPQAVSVMQEAAREVWKYGDSASFDLRSHLAARHGVAMDNIVIGAGIDGLLGSLVRLTVPQGAPVVTSDGAYPTFNYHVTGHGGVLHRVAYTADHEDPERLIAKAAEVGARLIYLSNPDNPMGTWHDGATVKRMVEAVPEGSLLVLDEAYIDFAPRGTAPEIDPEDPRVIRMRTFSKAHGLAGARVGYAIGDAALIGVFDLVRDHFGIGRISQAGALAAAQDADWLTHVRAEVAGARNRIQVIAADNGLTALPSAASFVAVDCGGDGGLAKSVLSGLLDRDIFARMPFVAPQDRCIRISAGRPKDLDLLADALPGALADAKKR